MRHRGEDAALAEIVPETYLDVLNQMSENLITTMAGL